MAEKKEELLFAKVAGWSKNGVSLIFPGDSESTKKIYKCNKAAGIKRGDTVKLTRTNGTYVIDYVVGAGSTPLKNMNKCPDNATAATCAAWINTIIEGLSDLGLMMKNGW